MVLTLWSFRGEMMGIEHVFQGNVFLSGGTLAGDREAVGNGKAWSIELLCNSQPRGQMLLCDKKIGPLSKERMAKN